MIKIVRTDGQHPDFVQLVKQLDADLAIRDGEDHAFYNQFNKIENLNHVVIGYENAIPVACGAIKKFYEAIMEVKRMYTLPASRGKGIAGQLLNELENWAAESGCSACVLETGKKQPEAIAFYKKSGYKLIPNYGQYAGIENSLCFEKKISLP